MSLPSARPARPSAAHPARRLLAVNGGSSTVKFALFTADPAPRRLLSGELQGIGQPESRLVTRDAGGRVRESRRIAAPGRAAGGRALLDAIRRGLAGARLAAIGHRVVHGGPKHWRPQRITPALLRDLRRLSPFDPEHLPGELRLIAAFRRHFPRVPQIACFDTAFHHDLPRVAQLLPLPRRFADRGVRRYGFHGLSCAYLLEELARVAGPRAARGRVLLAHLGGGASITAVRGGRSIDTSMSFTPTAGLPMGTRSGDLDPGLAWYLAREEGVTPARFEHMVNHESGLLGISGTTSEVRRLLAREKDDPRAAEAVALFCYQAKKWICALAGALDGLDTLVFSGGIGENAPEVRARICRGLAWLGVRLDLRRNRAGVPVISAAAGAVTVRVIPTDEERMIARTLVPFAGSRPSRWSQS